MTSNQTPMIRALLLVFFLTETIAVAGVKYQFTRSSTGDPLRPSFSGTIFIERNSYRIESGKNDAVISRDGGKTEQVLNVERKTYFDPARLRRHGGDSLLFELPVGRDAKVDRIRIELNEEPESEQIAGFRVRKYVLRFGYRLSARLSGHKLEAQVDAIALLWAASDLSMPRFPIEPMRLITGYQSVDTEVAKRITEVPPVIVKKQLSVTRIIDGGSGYTDLIIAEMTSMESVRTTPKLFELPAGYRYEEPVFATPGVATVP